MYSRRSYGSLGPENVRNAYVFAFLSTSENQFSKEGSRSHKSSRGFGYPRCHATWYYQLRRLSSTPVDTDLYSAKYISVHKILYIIHPELSTMKTRVLSTAVAAIILSLYLVSLVNASDPIFYCLEEGQTLELSRCNLSMPDFHCNSIECQICTVEISPGVFASCDRQNTSCWPHNRASYSRRGVAKTLVAGGWCGTIDCL